MADQSNTVTKYLSDLLAAARHCKEAMEWQLDASFMNDSPSARESVRTAHTTLQTQIASIERRLDELDSAGSWKQAVTTLSGFFTGLYDRVRTDRLSRALRDDYTALHLINISQAMMITTAAACGDDATTELVREQHHQLPPRILAIADQIPAAVSIDLQRDNVPITTPRAPEIAVRAMHSAWGHTSTQTA